MHIYTHIGITASKTEAKERSHSMEPWGRRFRVQMSQVLPLQRYPTHAISRQNILAQQSNSLQSNVLCQRWSPLSQQIHSRTD